MKSATGQKLLENLIYDKTRFNIAVHFRNGDISQRLSYFEALIQNVILKVPTHKSDDLALPYLENYHPLLVSVQNNDRLNLNVSVIGCHELSALETMIHFIKQTCFWHPIRAWGHTLLG